MPENAGHSHAQAHQQTQLFDGHVPPLTLSTRPPKIALRNGAAITDLAIPNAGFATSITALQDCLITRPHLQEPVSEIAAAAQNVTLHRQREPFPPPPNLSETFVLAGDPHSFSEVERSARSITASLTDLRPPVALRDAVMDADGGIAPPKAWLAAVIMPLPTLPPATRLPNRAPPISRYTLDLANLDTLQRRPKLATHAPDMEIRSTADGIGLTALRLTDEPATIVATRITPLSQTAKLRRALMHTPPAAIRDAFAAKIPEFNVAIKEFRRRPHPPNKHFIQPVADVRSFALLEPTFATAPSAEAILGHPRAMVAPQVFPQHGLDFASQPLHLTSLATDTLRTPPGRLRFFSPEQAFVEAFEHAYQRGRCTAPATFADASQPQQRRQMSPLSGDAYGLALAKAALRQRDQVTIYSAKYEQIPFPMGDLPNMYGSCTEVVIRAYRDLGFDLQETVHNARVGVSDRNIDHRRTQTLRKFFALHGAELPVTPYPENYKPGDIVTYHRPHSRVSRAHIAIVSHLIAPTGRPYIIHNRGYNVQLEDALFVDRMTGHYRFRPKPQPGLDPNIDEVPVALAVVPALPTRRTEAQKQSASIRTGRSRSTPQTPARRLSAKRNSNRKAAQKRRQRTTRQTHPTRRIRRNSRQQLRPTFSLGASRGTRRRR